MFDVDYFINKFEKIPEHDWCVGMFDGPRGSHCAMGHCGLHENGKDTNESNALRKLFTDWETPLSAVDVNDGFLSEWLYTIGGDTPKERMLNALRLIKKTLP